jgi:PAS domain S-box-containing protein
MLYQRLLTSAEALQKIIDIIPSPVFVKDAGHRLVLVNDALALVIGQAREALLGKTDFDIFPATQAEGFWAADDEVFSTGMTNEREEQLTIGTGEVRTVVTRKSMLRIGPGQGRRFLVGVISDVTAYREAAAQNHFLSRHDVLTGLPNRTLFHERLREAVGRRPA